jgi:hypothetical protein
MPDKNYVLSFKRAELVPQIVRAENFEIHGEHLVFLGPGGELAALFLIEIVKDCSESTSARTRVSTPFLGYG